MSYISTFYLALQYWYLLTVFANMFGVCFYYSL